MTATPDPTNPMKATAAIAGETGNVTADWGDGKTSRTRTNGGS